MDNDNHVYDPNRKVTEKRIQVPRFTKAQASEAVIKQMELEQTLENERLRISRAAKARSVRCEFGAPSLSSLAQAQLATLYYENMEACCCRVSVRIQR